MRRTLRSRIRHWFALVLACIVSIDPLDLAAQPSTRGLHIVVIDGEDAVNIIQQKTAVAPVVEVRDRNDQPVAGAVVSFAIRSGRATFGGARTLSVTTNAAGRAVAASLAPTGSGALQITASAAFQGQTAAAITIAQTNVVTAAEAAAIGASSTGGGSSGAAGAGSGAGGGGISGTTIGLVGAAVGGGALVAAKAAGGDDSGSTGSGTADQTCTFTVSPQSIAFPSAATAATVTVTVNNPGCSNPAWTATSISSFISFSGGSGSGNGSFVANAAANSANLGRTGNINVAGRIVEFVQEGSCPFNVSPTSLGTVPTTGATFSIAVTVASPTCNPNWTAFPNQPQFVTVSPVAGTGNGVVTVTISARGALASGPQPVSATIAGQLVAGVQLGF